MNQTMDEMEPRMSKNEQKRLAKLRERQERRSEQQTVPSSTSITTAAVTIQIPPHLHYENRMEIFQNHDYPHFSPDVLNFAAFKTQWDHIKTGYVNTTTEVRVRGRIRFIRSAGERLRFYVIRRGEEEIQIVCQLKESEDLVAYQRQHENLGRGDIIGVVGYPGRTSPRGRPLGELSIFAEDVLLLAPCLPAVPGEKFGFADVEQRHRNRALDLIMNRDTRNMFRARDRMNAFIANYLRDRDYISVETPILGRLSGGASAKPFMTYHNDMKRDFSLRIATELQLKPLIVGGLERVFEIGKVFRNEDIDLTHYPEFSSCEFYEADADYYDMMAITEDMISSLVKEVTGSYVTTFTETRQEKDGTEKAIDHQIDWTTPWKRIEMMPALEAACEVSFPDNEQLHAEKTRVFLLDLLKKHDVACSAPQTNARMLDKLVERFIESVCVNPTFVINHPKLMSPLAKTHRSYPGLTERAEAFVFKREICNLFTELNDPFEQRERFLEQARQKAQGDDEAQGIDEDFIRALEYGLPPTGGCGIGLDRILMFLTNTYSIKEVLAYPIMRDGTRHQVVTEGSGGIYL